MRPILQRRSCRDRLSLYKLTSATRPNCPPTLLVSRFFRSSFFNQQCKTTVWLPNLYIHCSIVTHVTNTASEYRPTLGRDIKSCTTILILINGSWTANENSFKEITQWVVVWLGTVLEIPGMGRNFNQIYISTVCNA